ncbi:MAG: rRNA pseudouridine synthase [Ruminococcaceae bacterium]|nr:rRNA pseudouridine synthase [Oscillospiraceae bacterium]
MEKSTVRLQKYFTDCGVLSRRAAEAEIAAGRVTVNGTVATTGQPVTPGVDTVVWRGKRVVPRKSDHRYVLLNKPRGFVTTMADEKGRPTVRDLVRDVGTRVYPVGRLDMDSDGLLLLTDDGDLANRLTHPRHEIPKLYHVTVKGAVSPEALARLGKPFLLDGYETLPATVTLLTATPQNTTLSFTLFEGRNRQIRRMCETVALSITRLTRVALGQITLLDLPEGKWRELTPDEVAYLKGN